MWDTLLGSVMGGLAGWKLGELWGKLEDGNLGKVSNSGYFNANPFNSPQHVASRNMSSQECNINNLAGCDINKLFPR